MSDVSTHSSFSFLHCTLGAAGAAGAAGTAGGVGGGVGGGAAGGAGGVGAAVITFSQALPHPLFCVKILLS